MEQIPLISLRFAKHTQMPYPTAGDWRWEKDGSLLVRTINMPSVKSMLLVQFHELVEAILCKAHGVDQAAVTAFDKQSTDAEPGDSPDAPYTNEHSVAMAMERLMARELGIPWQEHERNLDVAMEIYDNI